MESFLYMYLNIEIVADCIYFSFKIYTLFYYLFYTISKDYLIFFIDYIIEI